MKNNIFAALISLLIIITPQLALSAEGSDAEEEESGSDSGTEESSSGTAAGSGAAGSAIGGIGYKLGWYLYTLFTLQATCRQDFQLWKSGSDTLWSVSPGKYLQEKLGGHVVAAVLRHLDFCP